MCGLRLACDDREDPAILRDVVRIAAADDDRHDGARRTEVQRAVGFRDTEHREQVVVGVVQRLAVGAQTGSVPRAETC